MSRPLHGHHRSRARVPLARLFLMPLLAAFRPAAPPAAEKSASGWRAGPAECALLDDAKVRGKMDGLLLQLLLACGRADELGRVPQEVALEPVPAEGELIADVQVNDSTGDDQSTSTTQSETSIVRNEVTGTLCSGYNDSHSGFVEGSFTGFSRSTDGGATWEDRGALPSGSGGDPSVVWRRSDGKVYFAALRQGGVGVWRSDDDCLTFTFVAQAASGSDDKELMAVDNDPGSPFFGRLYMVWTDFGAGASIFETHSSDAGATWSSQVALSGAGVDVQGAWPVVGPGGVVYAGWVRWNPWVPSGNTTMDIEISRSTDGGATWGLVTNPVTGVQHPSDAGASAACGRPALNENIRYLPSPQLVVGPDGALHAVYSYDPDGWNVGDVVNVYYRKSTDGGATWGPELLLNDDGGLNDQYYPTLSVGAENILVSTWYDRRLDLANAMQDTFKSVSPDGGATWLANERVSDVSTPIFLDPNLATCYHGDYDQIAQETGFALLQWADDRNLQNGHNDPDVWFERQPVSNDFLLLADPAAQDVCAPGDAAYTIDVLQFQGFDEPVTLSAAGHPAGTSVVFSVNPVTPPGTSVMTVSGTGGAAAGSYDLVVTGTAPSATHEVTVGLALFDQLPAAPQLLAPPDGAVNQPARPLFEWSAAAQAATYAIEIATDAGFGNVVDAAAGIAQTTYSPAADLETNTQHFWRVRAVNACGTGADSATFDFITEPLPGDCTFGSPPRQVFFDDLESGAPGWTHSGTGDTWTLSGTRTHSGASAFYAQDVGVVTDQYLVSPAVALPLGEAPLTLQFWNWQEIEDSGGGCYDGAVIEISTDEGASWQRLEAELLTDPYDGEVSGCCGNPIAGENAWCGDPQDWLQSIVDLDAFAGQTALFRFRLATDSSVSREGWYVDDVEVQSCLENSVIFADGFESGDLSAWTAAVP